MKKMLVMVLTLGLLLMGVTAVLAGGDKTRGEVGQGDTHEVGCEDQPCPSFDNAPKPGTTSTLTAQTEVLASELDETEIAHLVFIREEEKMARDVYLVLSEQWGNPVFANIAESEQAHMNAMANLLTYYGIEDPVTSDDIGAFTNPVIAAIYNGLVDCSVESDLPVCGSASEADALLVGGYIEEYDIFDIWKAYEDTDEERIKRVYQNLYEGSYNHLDAFVYNYERLTDKIYEPRLLSAEDYAQVMDFVTQAKQAQQPKQQKGR